MGEKIQGDYLYVLVHKFDEFCGVYKKITVYFVINGDEYRTRDI